MAGTGVGDGEGVVWLCEAVAVRAGDGYIICYIICYIDDDDIVPDVRLPPSHIQGVGKTPGEENGLNATFNLQAWTGSGWIRSVYTLASCPTSLSSTPKVVVGIRIRNKF